MVVVSAWGATRYLRFSTISERRNGGGVNRAKLASFDYCPAFYAARRQNNARRVNETLFAPLFRLPPGKLEID